MVRQLRWVISALGLSLFMTRCGLKFCEGPNTKRDKGNFIRRRDHEVFQKNPVDDLLCVFTILLLRRAGLVPDDPPAEFYRAE